MILVALYQNDTWVSRLIRFWTKSKYSHSELWNTETGEVISADAEGVVLKPIPATVVHGRGIKIDTFYHSPVLSPKQESAVWQRALDLVGWKYDYFAVFLGFTLGLPENAESLRRWFCSEVVIEAFRRAEQPLLSRARADRISPRDLALSPKLHFLKTYIKKK
jgi:hypothetical protein